MGAVVPSTLDLNAVRTNYGDAGVRWAMKCASKFEKITYENGIFYVPQTGNTGLRKLLKRVPLMNGYLLDSLSMINQCLQLKFKPSPFDHPSVLSIPQGGGYWETCIVPPWM